MARDYICIDTHPMLRMHRLQTSFALSFLFLLPVVLRAQVKLEGFGSGTKAGAGKKIVHVTNLNSSGPGSLFDAIGSDRTIVFDVAGTIKAFRWDASDHNVVISYLTIDGSTAPAPGITLDNVGRGGDCLSFQNGCHDIIVKNIRVRNAGNDGFSVVRNCYNIVFDHCSSVNNGDGDLDITDGCYNITVQWCIFGHSVSGAMLIAFPGTRDISVHHNLFSSSGTGAGERNPLVHNAVDYKARIVSYLMADFSNNVVWKWGRGGGGFGYGSAADYGGTLQARNNFYCSVLEPSSPIIRDHNAKGAKIYASGNVSGNANVEPNTISNVRLPWPVAPVTMQDACVAAKKVLLEAGPRPLDAIDSALINDVSLADCHDVANQLPIVSAGEDITVNLPITSITLKGSASDRDGKIVDYQWTKLTGPKKYTIKSTNQAVATVSNLAAGTYVFQLMATDNRGAAAADIVTVVVKPGHFGK
jgi:K319-like protein